MDVQGNSGSIKFFTPISNEDVDPPVTNMLEHFSLEPHVGNRQSGQSIAVSDRVLGDYEIIILARGRGRVILSEDDRIFKEAEFVLIPPYVRHSIYSFSDEPFENYWIHFDVHPAYRQVYFNKIWGCEKGLIGAVPWNFSSFLEGAFNHMETKPCGRLGILHAILTSLLSGVCCPAMATLLEMVRENSVLDRCLDFVRTRYRENLTIDRICRACGVGRSKLFELFSLELGCSPGEFILMSRLQEAERLLKISDKTVAEISAEIGFGTAASLYSHFKRRYGKTPLQYRADFLV
jgi:AraC-like DNA-binding protein